MYEKLEKIQELLWKDDDRMEQDTLFELQDKVAELILEVAGKEGPKTVDRLVAKFPWLYKVEGDD